MKRGERKKERKVDAPVSVEREEEEEEEEAWSKRHDGDYGGQETIRADDTRPTTISRAHGRSGRERGSPPLKRNGVNSNEFRLSSSFPSNLPRNNLLLLSLRARSLLFLPFLVTLLP